MGFSSWLCKGCNQSIRNCVSGEHPWMYSVACLKKDGSIIFGSYSGYGSINTTELGTDEEMWHRFCWEVGGRPSYSGVSPVDPEQGHFGPAPIHPTVKVVEQEEAHEQTIP